MAQREQIPSVIARNLVSAVEDYRPSEIVLQYTSQMWNAWRFGTPAMTLFLRRLRRTGARITIIAHELFVPWLPRPDLAIAAFLQRVQLATLVRECDRFFVTTETRARVAAPLCRLAGAVAPQVIRIGANTVPVERRPRSPVASATAPKIGFFSTAAVGKKYDVVLDAFARIASEIPGAELILMGDLGPPDQPNVRAILEEVARHPAKARIRLTGRLSLAELANEMATLDLYLFAMETGANTRSSTLPSALGAGIPTVAVRGRETDLSLFHDGDSLVFADDMTGPAFAAAALRLLKEPVGAGACRRGRPAPLHRAPELGTDRRSPVGRHLLVVTAVLVSHPHVAAVALGLAEALAAEGKLAAFVTGVAFRQESTAGRAAALLAQRWPVLRNRILSAPSSDRLRSLFAAELGARLAARALANVWDRASLYNALFTTHDLATALARLAARDDRGLRL